MSDPPPQLDYTGRAPWHRRRGARRALILVAGILLGLSLWRFGPEAIQRTQLLLLQHKAMAYSAPLGTVAFTVDKEHAKKCMALGGYASSDEYHAALIVTPWKDFYAKYSPPGGSAPIAFCHELVSPGGHHRLVVVNIGDRSSFEVSSISLTPGVFIPGSLMSAPMQRLMSGFGTTIPGYGTTIYVGQVDPADASHFTIEIDLAGSHDTIDGYLLDNDTVTLDPRDDATNLFPKPTTWNYQPPALQRSTTNALGRKHKKRKQTVP